MRECVALYRKYVYERGLTRKTLVALETGAGVKTLHLQVRDGVVELISWRWEKR